jgi:hypothetical protein
MKSFVPPKTSNKILKSMVLVLAIAATVHAQPTDNVVAYYPFNGNAYDVTGNGKNATVSGATLTADRLGKANAAYSFNGTNNLIYLPNNLVPGNAAFCVSFWFKFSGTVLRPADYGEQLIDFRGQYNFNIAYLQYNHPSYPKSIAFNIANSSANNNCLSPNNSIQDTTWYHVVANYGNNTMQLYLNGSLVDTKPQTPPAIVAGYNSTIGKDYNMNRDRLWFNGIIDEVLIYKRSLTSSEILALYNRGLTSSDIPELIVSTMRYTYDETGNCTKRNVLILNTPNLKSARLDSAELAGAVIPGNDIYEDHLGNHKILIFPNPTRGQIQIEIQDYVEEPGISLYLYSISGKLLINKTLVNSSLSLDLSTYSSGTYILKMILGDKTSEWKIIKE